MRPLSAKEKLAASLNFFVYFVLAVFVGSFPMIFVISYLDPGCTFDHCPTLAPITARPRDLFVLVVFILICLLVSGLLTRRYIRKLRK